ncbi:phosphatidylcholine transfer protein [Electrophorus electricus]|uniref:Phosphatidylcholine transfer protein n=1 Tax=Electrophorus electricus TaxID=8005 RepID=A0AAY5F6G3_ELEEL|nr:phosphatidylcholine transfer protein [Electrophorus electricus]
MALLFCEREFQDAWRELDKPQVGDGWELFAQTTGVDIYRHYVQDSGLYEYKVFGSLSTTPELCADVYMDLGYRKQWDSYVKELYEMDCGGLKAIYWEVKYPFPLSNRDYVYVRERRDLEVDGRKIWVVLAKSSEVSQCAEKPGVIRVKDYKQSVALESDGSDGSKVFMNYFDNPGGNIPTWLVNWAAKSGVPAFLTDMQKACGRYTAYCRNRK